MDLPASSVKQKTAPGSSFIILLNYPWQVKWLKSASMLHTLYSVDWQPSQPGESCQIFLNGAINNRRGRRINSGWPLSPQVMVLL